jgi:hypothetical protein
MGPAVDWHPEHWRHLSASAINGFLIAWFIGGAILGLILGGITYLVTYSVMLVLFPKGE